MDSQGFQYEFQHVSSCFAWCCYCSRRRDRQMHPQVSSQSESRFSDQRLHGLHSKLQSNTMKTFTVKHTLHTKKLPAGFRSCISGEMRFYAHYSYDFSCSLLFWEPSHRLHNVGPDVWCEMLRRASTCLPLAWTPCHSQGTATLTDQRCPSLWSCVARSRHQDSQALQADVNTRA